MTDRFISLVEIDIGHSLKPIRITDNQFPIIHDGKEYLPTVFKIMIPQIPVFENPGDRKYLPEIVLPAAGFSIGNGLEFPGKYSIVEESKPDEVQIGPIETEFKIRIE